MATKREHVNDGDTSNTNNKKQRVAVPSSSLSAKITKLMHAAQLVLDHDEGDQTEMKDYMGEKPYLHLSEVLYALNDKAYATGMLKTYRANFPNGLPKSLSALSVTPWEASDISSEYPPLPRILDPTLETAVFTHRGIAGTHIGDLNYERLEWVGDTYLELTCTLLISQSFPALNPGPCSQLRERCVKNVTLAAYARHYGFDQRANLPAEIIANSKGGEMTKIMGDIFEAYAAAVILSDPEYGVTCVIDWLKKLWATELKGEIKAEEKKKQFDSPMWRLRGDVDKVELRSSAAEEPSAKQLLQKLIGAKGIKLTYKDAAPEKKDRTNNLPLFTVGVYLDGFGRQDFQLGYGQGNGKKEAGNKAAEMALGKKTLMKELTEKKELIDAQLERERAALESISAA